MFIFYLGLLNEVPEHMAQECEHFKGLLRKLGVLNEVPEHMAQELRDIHALTLGSLAPQ